MADPWQECMDYCVEVTKQACKMICEALQKDIAVMQKSSPVDLVTETDQKVEQLIISSIKEKYPTHSFIGEESVAAGSPSLLTDNPTWIIDPIDGTTNFVHRFPFVSVSIGFTVKKKVEFGIVYSCIEDKLYTARKGKGAFCNGAPIKVSGQQDICQSLVLTEMGFKKDPEHFRIMMDNMKAILTIPVHGIRSPGSAAVNMCLVACGAADAYYHMGIHCWDMAGGAAILTEAGGVIMDISGGPFDLMSRRLIIASSRPIAERLVKEITVFPCGRDDTAGYFIGEESVAAGQPCVFTDNPTWIVDPVDGTTNFVHGFPFVAVSIGFAVNKEMEFGVVYSCLEDKMYTGRKGKGAFCDGERLQVSDVAEIRKSMIISELGSNRDKETVTKIFSTMQKILCIPVHGIRGSGTAATNMCLVASGAVEAFFEIGIHCWDVAAGAVIVTEAGGVLMDVDGGPFDLMSRRMVSANNKTIADRLVKEIEIFPAARDDAPIQKK